MATDEIENLGRYLMTIMNNNEGRWEIRETILNHKDCDEIQRSFPCLTQFCLQNHVWWRKKNEKDDGPNVLEEDMKLVEETPNDVDKVS